MSEGVLKQGWRRVRFGEVVRLSTERASDPAAAGIERYVGLEHIEPGDLRIRRWGLVADGTTFTTRFRPGQVLFGKRRAYLRKVAVADFEGVCSGDIYVLEPGNGDLLPDLLPFICQIDAFLEHAVGTSAGSLSPRTKWESLASFEFMLPPGETQRRIATTLSEMRSAIDALEATTVAADKVRRATLLDVFRPDRGSRDQFPKHWACAAAATLGSVQLGQQRHPKYDSGPNVRPYLRVANVMDGWLDLSDVLSMHFPERDLPKFELEPGDILLNEGQSYDLVGRSAIYRGEIDGCCFQKTLLRFRCGPRLLPEFAQAYFQHMLYTGQFSAMCVQTTSMAHLTAVRFSAMAIPAPPLDEQRAIVQRIAVAEEARSLSQQRLEQARQLQVSLRETLLVPTNV